MSDEEFQSQWIPVSPFQNRYRTLLLTMGGNGLTPKQRPMAIIPSEIVDVAGVVQRESAGFAWTRLHFEEPTRQPILNFRDASLEHWQTYALVTHAPNGERRVVDVARSGIDENHRRASCPAPPAHCNHMSREVRAFTLDAFSKNAPTLLDAVADACAVLPMDRIGNLWRYRAGLKNLVGSIAFKCKRPVTSLREGAAVQEATEDGDGKRRPETGHVHHSILLPEAAHFPITA
jgi:hypothetical protein